MRLAGEIAFWVCCGLIVWTQAGYALALALAVRAMSRAGRGRTRPTPAGELPRCR